MRANPMQERVPSDAAPAQNDAGKEASASPRVQVFRFGVYELSTTSNELRKQGQLVRLTRIPFKLLLLLLESAPNWVSRKEIIDRVWGIDNEVSEASVTGAISTIR